MSNDKDKFETAMYLYTKYSKLANSLDKHTNTQNFLKDYEMAKNNLEMSPNDFFDLKDENLENCKILLATKSYEVLKLLRDSPSEEIRSKATIAVRNIYVNSLPSKEEERNRFNEDNASESKFNMDSADS
jgi:hypothetical protein